MVDNSDMPHGNIFEELESSDACRLAMDHHELKMHVLKTIEECSEFIVELCGLLQSKGGVHFEEFLKANAKDLVRISKRALVYPEIYAIEPEDTSNLTSEMADLLICAACIKTYYVPSEDLDAAIQFKLKRMKERTNEQIMKKRMVIV